MQIQKKDALASSKLNLEDMFFMAQLGVEEVGTWCQLVTAMFVESARQAQAMLGVKDSQEMLILQGDMVRKAAVLSRSIYDLCDEKLR